MSRMKKVNMFVKRMGIVSTVVLMSLVNSGCQEASVPVSECKNVVAHAKSILKEKSPSNSKMMMQCKAATDKARGCVMAADKPMKLLKCDF